MITPAPFPRIRFSLQELGGAFGDLGIFIPLSVAMIVTCRLDAGAVFFWAGFFSILSGLVFGLPVPVQPMKAIAALAIAEGLTRGEIAAAGLGVSLLLLAVTVSGILKKSLKFLPPELVRGIQLGIGLKLVIKGVEWSFSSSEPASLVLLVLSIALLAAGMKYAQFPGAMAAFLLGFVWFFFHPIHTAVSAGFAWPDFHIVLPAYGEWVSGLTRGALSQIPLTLLNSVIAVCALSGSLFPEKRIDEERMSYSLVVVGFFSCLFGGIPLCCGAGGLAAQYRFGGRTGGSPVIIGTIKIAAALMLGSSMVAILLEYPRSILGLLMVLSGIEIGKTILKNKGLRPWAVSIITGTAIIFTGTFWGFAAGAIAAVCLHYVRPSEPGSSPPAP